MRFSDKYLKRNNSHKFVEKKEIKVISKLLIAQEQVVDQPQGLVQQLAEVIKTSGYSGGYGGIYGEGSFAPIRDWLYGQKLYTNSQTLVSAFNAAGVRLSAEVVSYYIRLQDFTPDSLELLEIVNFYSQLSTHNAFIVALIRDANFNPAAAVKLLKTQQLSFDLTKIMFDTLAYKNISKEQWLVLLRLCLPEALWYFFTTSFFNPISRSFTKEEILSLPQKEMVQTIIETSFQIRMLFSDFSIPWQEFFITQYNRSRGMEEFEFFVRIIPTLKEKFNVTFDFGFLNEVYNLLDASGSDGFTFNAFFDAFFSSGEMSQSNIKEFLFSDKKYSRKIPRFFHLISSVVTVEDVEELFASGVVDSNMLTLILTSNATFELSELEQVFQKYITKDFAKSLITNFDLRIGRMETLVKIIPIELIREIVSERIDEQSASGFPADLLSYLEYMNTFSVEIGDPLFTAPLRKKLITKYVTANYADRLDSIVLTELKPDELDWFKDLMSKHPRRKEMLENIPFMSNSHSPEELSKSFVSGWKQSSRTPMSNATQLIMSQMDIFKGERDIKIYFNSRTPSHFTDSTLNKLIDDTARSNIQQFTTDVYSRTQASLLQDITRDQNLEYDKSKNLLHLYRGVESSYNVASPLESWSSRRNVADRFDGHQILEAWVPPEAVYVCWQSPDWSAEKEGDDSPGKTEREYILISSKVPMKAVEGRDSMQQILKDSSEFVKGYADGVFEEAKRRGYLSKVDGLRDFLVSKIPHLINLLMDNFGWPENLDTGRYAPDIAKLFNENISFIDRKDTLNFTGLFIQEYKKYQKTYGTEPSE